MYCCSTVLLPRSSPASDAPTPPPPSPPASSSCDVTRRSPCPRCAGVLSSQRLSFATTPRQPAVRRSSLQTYERGSSGRPVSSVCARSVSTRLSFTASAIMPHTRLIRCDGASRHVRQFSAPGFQ